jgi:hypothetical protein
VGAWSGHHASSSYTVLHDRRVITLSKILDVDEIDLDGKGTFFKILFDFGNLGQRDGLTLLKEDVEIRKPLLIATCARAKNPNFSSSILEWLEKKPL